MMFFFLLLITTTTTTSALALPLFCMTGGPTFHRLGTPEFWLNDGRLNTVRVLARMDPPVPLESFLDITNAPLPLLVAHGCRFIVVSDVSDNTLRAAAMTFPNVSFITHRDGPDNMALPNAVRISPKWFQATYLAGLTTALLFPTLHHVGFIFDTARDGILNAAAFAVGVHDVRPNTTVHVLPVSPQHIDAAVDFLVNVAGCGALFTTFPLPDSRNNIPNSGFINDYTNKNAVLFVVMDWAAVYVPLVLGVLQKNNNPTTAPTLFTPGLSEGIFDILEPNDLFFSNKAVRAARDRLAAFPSFNLTMYNTTHVLWHEAFVMPKSVCPGEYTYDVVTLSLRCIEPIPHPLVSVPVVVIVSFLASALILSSLAYYTWVSKKRARRYAFAPMSNPVALVSTSIDWGENMEGDLTDVRRQYSAILRRTLLAHHGYEVRWRCDSILFAFQRPSDAVAFALFSQLGLLEVKYHGPEEGLRVRMGIHVGAVHILPSADGHVGYEGQIIHETQQYAAAAHGGQILLSRKAYNAVLEHLNDLGTPVNVNQVADVFSILPAALNNRVFAPRFCQASVGSILDCHFSHVRRERTRMLFPLDGISLEQVRQILRGVGGDMFAHLLHKMFFDLSGGVAVNPQITWRHVSRILQKLNNGPTERHILVALGTQFGGKVAGDDCLDAANEGHVSLPRETRSPSTSQNDLLIGGDWN